MEEVELVTGKKDRMEGRHESSCARADARTRDAAKGNDAAQLSAADWAALLSEWSDGIGGCDGGRHCTLDRFGLASFGYG